MKKIKPYTTPVPSEFLLVPTVILIYVALIALVIYALGHFVLGSW